MFRFLNLKLLILIVCMLNFNFYVFANENSINEIVIDGIDTNIELHKRILSSADFKKGAVPINWLENNIQNL